jgi:hypothetical protein
MGFERVAGIHAVESVCATAIKLGTSAAGPSLISMLILAPGG